MTNNRWDDSAKNSAF